MPRKWVEERIKREKASREKFRLFIDGVRGMFKNRVSIILFGSRASGDYHVGSDYDVIVVAEKYSTENIFNRISCIRRKLNIQLNIQIIPLTLEELYKSIEDGSIIVKEALSRGEIIYDGLNIGHTIKKSTSK